MHPHTPSQNIADVSDATRDKALRRTAETLSKLDKMRQVLEMPVDQLPILIETYGENVRALIAEDEREDLAARTLRVPLTMRSENRDYEPTRVVPGKMLNVIARPQRGSFRPEDFAIHGDRSRWLVHDVTIGGRSQFTSQRGPALGTEFGPGGILEHLRLETVQTAMDLVLKIEYIGPEPEGEMFEATVVGTSVAL